MARFLLFAHEKSTHLPKENGIYTIALNDWQMPFYYTQNTASINIFIKPLKFHNYTDRHLYIICMQFI